MKKKISRIVSLLLICTLVLTACGRDNDKNNTQNQNNENTAPNTNASTVKEIYFLNFKPEIADKYKEIAKAYESETGTKVKVVTAASGTYEQTLKSEVAKKNAPAIFQINGPIGYQSWKNYCADLSNTSLYSNLTDQSLAITEGDGVYGIPYAVEGYGIIYNNAIMQKYFALNTKATGVTSVDEINNFATLKAVVEDMQKNKTALGIEGVFASTSLGSGEQWRWQSHLATVPFYYEFQGMDSANSTIITSVGTTDIQFQYSDNFKNILDLYLNNSVTDPKMLGTKSVADSMAEFALGKCAMVQNGDWAWSQISGVSGNTVSENDIKILPIYIGIEGEENQGICIGTENYFAVNAKLSTEMQEAAINFLEWLFSSETGKRYVVEDLGFNAPFSTFTEEEKPSDPLSREVLRYLASDKQNIEWTFAGFPSDQFKNAFGDAILQYAQGTKTWEQVKEDVIIAWKDQTR